jgi:hypothetical protein
LAALLLGFLGVGTNSVQVDAQVLEIKISEIKILDTHCKCILLGVERYGCDVLHIFWQINEFHQLIIQ